MRDPTISTKLNTTGKRKNKRQHLSIYLPEFRAVDAARTLWWMGGESSGGRLNYGRPEITIHPVDFRPRCICTDSFSFISFAASQATSRYRVWLSRTATLHSNNLNQFLYKNLQQRFETKKIEQKDSIKNGR